jgi:hypothetical protein
MDTTGINFTDKIVIGKGDIPYLIVNEGYYGLSDDLCCDPSINGTVAITVDSDGVTVDLDKFKLYQKDGNSRHMTGIKVLSGRSNVGIIGKNGSISGFNGSGICYEGPNDGFTIIGITVSNCGSDQRAVSFGTQSIDGGIIIGKDITSNVTDRSYAVSNGLIDRVTVTRSKNRGIFVVMTDNIMIRDTTIEDVSTNTPALIVAGLDLHSDANGNVLGRRGRNVRIERCKINGIVSDVLTAGGVLFGLGLFQFDDIIIKDCMVTNSSATCPNGSNAMFCCNFLGAGCKNIRLEGNQFTGVVSTGVYFTQNFHVSANTLVNGLGEVGNLYMDRCLMTNSIGDFIVANAEIAYAKDSLVENCRSYTIHSRGINPGTLPLIVPQAIGFLFTGGRAFNGSIQNEEDNRRGNLSGLTIKNCLAQGITTEKGIAAAFSYFAGTFNMYKESGVNPEKVTLADPVIVLKIDFSSCKADGVLSKDGVGAGYLIDKGLIPSTDTLLGITTIVLNGPNNGDNKPTFRYIPYKYADELTGVTLKDCVALNCRGTDPNSAGIIVSSVKKPVIDGCVVKDCSKGILLTGGTVSEGSLYPGIPNVFDPVPKKQVDLGITEGGVICNNDVDNSNVGYQDSAIAKNLFTNNISAWNTVSDRMIPDWNANKNCSIPYM